MRGDVLQQGRYRLIEEYLVPKNQRGFSSAWIATDMAETRQRVLLYQLALADSANTPNSPTHVQNEEKIVANLVQHLKARPTHRGLPTILNVFREQSTYYLVQQFPVGETLALLMLGQGGALPEHDVAEYGRQLCEILAVLAHQQPPIVHGAINPKNVVISPDNKIVSLLDLPLLPSAKPIQKTNSLTDSSSSYTAPEQARGGEAQPSSDLYALAATLHHAVTGFDPRERMVFFYPPARRLNPLVSARMEAILARQLRFSISQRYASAEAMQKDFADLITSYPPIMSNTSPSSNSAAHKFALSRPAKRPEPFWIRHPISIALFSLLVLTCFLLIIFPLLLNHSTMQTSTANVAQKQAALTKQIALETQAFRQKGIGLSDGTMVFDPYQGRTDTNLKKQAASALQQGNTSAAVNLLNQATNVDPTDGEAQIYNENIHIQQNNFPYITLAVGIPIDESALHLGPAREELETIYLMQHAVNSKNMLPNGQKLRILLGNSGANNADVATVAQFIADRVSKAGNLDHLVGVIGWYTSSQTIDARDIIASAHLPLIAPVASSVKLSGSSSYFFRVAPPDDSQGKVLGKLLINQLQAKKVLILTDSTDSYSVSLANAVALQVKEQKASFVSDTFTENVTTVDQYRQLIEKDVRSDAAIDAIFLAGFNVDGIRLAHAVGEASRDTPTDTRLSRLKVVGGDGVDSRLLLGEGNSADAEIARNYPQDMRRLLFTTFADFNEWNTFSIPQNNQPAFFNDWKAMYQSSLVRNNATTPAYTGLMFYDAVGVCIHAASLVQGEITGDKVRDILVTLGKGTVSAYQGISGRIRFDEKGNPVDKAVVVLTVQDTPNGNDIAILQVLGTFR